MTAGGTPRMRIRTHVRVRVRKCLVVARRVLNHARVWRRECVRIVVIALGLGGVDAARLAAFVLFVLVHHVLWL